MGTQRTWKPSGSSSARMVRPTCSTPARFSVPLLVFTSRSSRAMERSVLGASGGDHATLDGAEGMGGGRGARGQSAASAKGA
jgi:hypothetical protein